VKIVHRKLRLTRHQQEDAWIVSKVDEEVSFESKNMLKPKF